MVIGSGPAGSTSAYRLAKNNVETLLIEKDELPRHKTCAGGLTDKTMRLMHRVFGRSTEELEKDGPVNFSTVDWRVGFHETNLTSFQVKDEIYFTDRKEYDHFLFREAEKQGIDRKIGEVVTGFDFEDHTLRTAGGSTVHHDYLFAADGVHSTTRKALLAREDFECPYWFDQLALGLEAYVSRDRVPKEFNDARWMDLRLGLVNWGYAWVFPHHDQLLVGVGGLQTQNDNFRSALMEYGELLGLDLGDATVKGHPIPFGNYLREPCHRNVLLLGDAGGFANPLTGEGIFYAQRSGELAAEAYLRSDGNSTEKLYRKLIHHHILPEMTGAWRVRPFVYGGPPSLRKPVLHCLSKTSSPEPLAGLVQGHRVWHNFAPTGHRLHDTVELT